MNSAWNRFETYTRRVRTLVFDINPTTGDALNLTALQTVMQFRPSAKDLLPNLRKFTYKAGRLPSVQALPPFLIFLGASIVKLKLLEITPMALPDFLEHLTQKVPQVQYVRIEGTELSQTGSGALASSLIHLEKLRDLQVSAVSLTPAMWDTMAQHPSLLSAELSLPRFVPDAISFQPKAFTKLRNLAIQADLGSLCSLLESQNDLPTVTCVDIRGNVGDQERSYFHRLCELLFQKLSDLASVRLRGRTRPLPEGEPFGLEDFRPLLRCKSIQHFHLEHPCGVSMNMTEVAELLDAWPCIDTLALQYATFGRYSSGMIYGLKWTPPTLPLTVLDTVAEKAPQIRELRLVLNASTAIDSTLGTHQRQFERLQELEVTLSTVDQPKDVASYLAQRSKNRFSLKFLSPQKVQGDVLQKVDGEKAKWDQVVDYLDLLFDQKERLEQGFKLRMVEERARLVQELGGVGARSRDKQVEMCVPFYGGRIIILSLPCPHE
ncbi:hypothetical protein FRC01_012660 [Tulasnella sp. 417]|nr:hypothetical protein FRC01_012660 [Tulasnella sp. 417]